MNLIAVTIAVMKKGIGHGMSCVLPCLLNERVLPSALAIGDGRLSSRGPLPLPAPPLGRDQQRDVGRAE